MKRLLSWRKFLRNNEVRFIWFSFEILDTIFGGIAGRPLPDRRTNGCYPSRLPRTLICFFLGAFSRCSSSITSSYKDNRSLFMYSHTVTFLSDKNVFGEFEKLYNHIISSSRFQIYRLRSIVLQCTRNRYLYAL